MVLLLLMAAGCAVFTAMLCVLRARSSRYKTVTSTERVYDTIQTKGMVANQHCYIDEVQEEDPDREYETIQEGKVTIMTTNVSYCHVGGREGVRTNASARMEERTDDVDYDEVVI